MTFTSLAKKRWTSVSQRRSANLNHQQESKYSTF